MMKTKQLIFSFLLLFFCNTINYAQCTSCNDAFNVISYTGGGDFTAASAQAYYWEICEGNAVIQGSNTTKSVSVNCSGNYKIKVTRFINGNCEEACYKISNCPVLVNCIINELKPICSSGNVMISRGHYTLSCTSADWTINYQNNFEMGYHTNTSVFKPFLLNLNFYGPITIKAYYPNTNIEMASFVSFVGDCLYIENPFLNPFRVDSSIDNLSIYPNPTKDGFLAIKGIKGNQAISKIDIINSLGKLIKSIKDIDENLIDLSMEKKGIYFVKIELTDGTTSTEKIVLE